MTTLRVIGIHTNIMAGLKTFMYIMDSIETSHSTLK